MGKSINTNQAISYLGPQTVLEGQLHASSGLHIDGRFDGDIVCNSDVILGEGSHVAGTIRANNVYISGRFSGDVSATELLEISSTGHVEGAIKGSQLIVKEGGVYKGTVSMDVIQSESMYEGTFQVVKK